ncbi:M48 family metalloprotease [Solihabitans fulvus]|uniref:M48 family metalloprotease n=1 Tax=Solihabitans fulvus TaxID=1892852 RepID=A0A5B2XHX9_9PSEU|nr:M48 family metallopeptidase [Solihabitans fulvus]KAA2262430.1 M48 family metalloprotease [Solihabitans fulvus]
MRISLRAVLALLLLLGFFVLVLALTFGLAGLSVWAFASGHGGAGAVKLGLGGIAIAVLVGTAVAKAMRIKVEPHGAPVSRAEQPELWRMVDELAAIAGTRGPDDIRLVPEVNAAVWEESHLLGLRRGRRYLELGLPLLAGLSVGELRAVLAHELGHYGEGHTTLSALTYRAKSALAHTIAEVDGHRLIRAVLGGYAKLYAMVAASANRSQELRADAASVAAAGRATAQNALRKLPALSFAWSDYGRSYLSLAGGVDRTPDILLGFHAYLSNPQRGNELRQAEVKLINEEPKSVFDSHPPIRKRIEAMERIADPALAPDHRPAWSVLVDAGNRVPALERALLRDDLGPRAQWPEIVKLAGATMARHAAAELARAGQQSGCAPRGTLDEALAALARGELVRLATPVLNPGLAAQHVPEAAATVMRELLAETAVSALVGAGLAEHRLNWGGPYQVVGRDGAPLDLEAVVGPSVANPAAVPWTRDQLRQLGVPLDYGAAAAGDPEADLVAVLTSVRHAGRLDDLWVCDTGLLLVQHGLTPGLVETPVDQLKQRPDTRWLDNRAIAQGQFHRRMGGWRLVLRAHDGTEVELASTNETKEAGEAYQALGRLLGARLLSG